jgi:predicted nicotinamide N-methyase
VGLFREAGMRELGQSKTWIAARKEWKTICGMQNRTQEQLAAVPIPGGWKWETIELRQFSWRLLLPADPDAFILQSQPNDEWPDPYWAQLWPAAKIMAAIVVTETWPPESQVLELGCGNGFVGLAAAARGSQVTFSDYVSLGVELALANARGNQLANVAGEVLDWKKPITDPRFDQILACDCLYDPELHLPLLNTLRARLAPGGQVWLGDPGRVGMAENFVRTAREHGWQVALFDQSHVLQSKFVRGEFRLMKLWQAGEVNVETLS